jgi:hypothetical protein
MTTSFPVASTASQSGIRAEHVRFAGVAAMVAAIVHFVYTILLTQVFTVGPDGLFPTGTFAFRVDGIISVGILGLYLVALAGLHARERGSYGRLGLVLALVIGASYAVDMVLWGTMVALATTTIAGIEGGLGIALEVTGFVGMLALLAYAVVLWRRTTVTRIGLAGLAAALPVGVPIAIALEPVASQSSWIVIVALIAAGWFAIGRDLQARPSPEPEATAVAA